MVALKKTLRGFSHALRGIRAAYRHELNFRIQLVVAFLVIVVSLLLPTSQLEYSILVITIALVLCLELINSAMERYLDLLESRVSGYAKVIKDILAGAVLISAISAIIIAFLIFIPKLAILYRG